VITKKIFISISLFSLIQASECLLEPSAKRAKTESITLYQTFNDENHAQSVQDHGLLSFPRAYEEGLVACPANIMVSAKLDRRKSDEDIYFSPLKTDASDVACEMNIENCFVFNAAYRKNREWVKYNNSKMPLDVYLQAVAMVKNLIITHPGKVFKLNPDHAAPEVVKKAKGKALQSLNSYDGEIVVRAGCIESKNLVFLKQ
jgi:hypothetical protein